MPQKIPSLDQKQLKLNIAIAQLNFTVGDMRGNADLIIAYAKKAKDELKADMVVFSELALSGYPPEDLLLRDDFYECVLVEMSRIKKAVPEIYLIFGYPEKAVSYNNDGVTSDNKITKYYNSAAVLYGEKLVANYRKQLLPNYGVFDEKRYFSAGDAKVCIVNINGVRVGFNICEDLWTPAIASAEKSAGAQIIITINASPFDQKKQLFREKMVAERAKKNQIPFIYVNTVGGQDELIFDGGSIVANEKGEIVERMPFCVEAMHSIEFQSALGVALKKEHLLPLGSEEELVYQALVLGVRDYVRKNKFQGVIIGLSGGIDSALTLAVAVDALGKDNVETFYMPSRYSHKISAMDSSKLAKNFKVKYTKISIEPIFKTYLRNLAKIFSRAKAGAMQENLQARIRAVLLMAASNVKDKLVLSTSNKSEIAVGYTTIYGDMIGGFAVLKDIYKTMVYRLVNWRNRTAGFDIIPQRVIERAPSAELKKNQVDTETLPPYAVLDEILQRYIEKDEAIDKIMAAGFAAETVCKVINMIKRNEYKRRQAPVGIKISSRAFGRDRRYPIANAFPSIISNGSFPK